MHVPVLFSKEFYRLVPQIQFISRVWDIAVVEQRRVRTVPYYAEDRRFVRCSSWWKLTRPLLRNDRDMVRQCSKPWRCRTRSTTTTTTTTSVAIVDQGSDQVALALVNFCCATSG